MASPIPAVDHPLRGILAMIAAVFMFAGMDAAMKQLTSDYSAMQITCLRAACAWPFIVAWLGVRGEFKYLLQARWRLHLLRAVLGIVMLAAFIKALETLALSDAYSVFFVAPLLITALSVWWLKDSVRPAQWAAIALGMAAVLYMLKPSGDELFSIGALMALISALCYAVSNILVRKLAQSDHAGNLVFWLMTFIGIGAFLLALPTWQPLQWQAHWPLFLAIGITGTAGQILITQAFRLASPAIIAPFEYTALVWGLGFDVLVWQMWPDRDMLIGGAVIIASGILVIWLQNTQQRNI